MTYIGTTVHAHYTPSASSPRRLSGTMADKSLPRVLRVSVSSGSFVQQQRQQYQQRSHLAQRVLTGKTSSPRRSMRRSCHANVQQ